MKVLDLRCGEQHVFEGWFASEDDFVAQNERAEVACPLCGDTAVIRLPSAPRINVGRHPEPAQTPTSPPSAPPSAESMAMTLQSQWLRAVGHVMSTTEDVGERFPEEARKIHYGEVEERGIRGRASQEDAQALRDEGIEVMAIPIPDALKGPAQ